MHTIRLRGPWSVEPVARFVLQADGTYRPESDKLPPAVKMTMPADWSAAFGADFYGRVRYRRTFQKPTGLGSGERVFLVVEPPRYEACITLKRVLVGFVYSGEPAGRFDVTDRLEDHNQLEIFVDHPPFDEMRSTVGDPTLLLSGGLVGEVRLEIEE